MLNQARVALTLVAALTFASMVLAGCDSDESSDSTEPAAATLVLESEVSEFYVSDIVRLRAIFTSPEGEESDVTSEAWWSLSDDTIATVTGPGILQGLAQGSTTLTVTFGSLSLDVALSVRDLEADLTGITIESGSETVPRGYSIPIGAKGLYADGQARDITELCEWQSLDPATLELREEPTGFQLFGLDVGSGTVRATCAGIEAEATFTVEILGLEEIEVVPFNLVLPLGSTYQLKGLGRFEKGGLIDLTHYLTWESSDPELLEVSNEEETKGSLLAVGEGDAIITASADGQTGTCTTTVTSAHVVALSVDPAIVNIPLGAATTLSASAVLEGGYALDVTGLATWTLNDESIARLTDDEEAGLGLEAIAPGETTLTVSYSDATIEHPVTIRDAELLEVNIFGPFDQIPAGSATSFAVLGTYGDNTQGNLTDVAIWSSSNPEVAFVSNFPNAGEVTGVSEGETVITATYGEFSVSAQLTVTQAEIVMVQVIPPISSVPLGDQVDYTALSVFSDGSVRNLATEATWSSSNPEVAVISNAEDQHGLANTLAIGDTTITVQLNDFTDTAQLTVRDAEIAFIIAVPSDLVLVPGRSDSMNALANYTNGSALLVTQEAVWTSDHPSIAVVSNTDGERGLVTALAPGTATIRVTNNGVEAERDVEVLDATLEAINIDPDTMTIPAGFSVQAEAIGQFDIEIDPEFANYTDIGVWASTDESVAIVESFPNFPGRVRAIAPGEATVSAGFGEHVGTAPVTVDNRQLVSMTIGPPNPTLPVDYRQPFVVFGTFDDGSSFQVTLDVTFESSDGTVATIINQDFFPGFVSTVQPGQATLTARNGDIEATTVVTVVDMEADTVVVAPVAPLIPRGQLFNFSATGVFPDGTMADFTNLCTWTSSDPTLFLAFDEVFLKGRVVGIGTGTGELTVRCANIETSTSITFF